MTDCAPHCAPHFAAYCGPDCEAEARAKRWTPIPEHHLPLGKTCTYIRDNPERGCYWCCEACNHNDHVCPGCGDDLRHDGRERGGALHDGCPE